MTTETKRDLTADLALCEAVVKGRWMPVDGAYVINPGWNGSQNETIAEFSTEAYAEFVAQASIGWRHAISRAIKAERLLRDIGTLSLVSDITEEDDDFYRFLERVEDAATFAKEQIDSDNHELCEYCGLEFERGTTTRDKLCKVCAEKEDIEYEEAEWRDLVEDDGELRSSYLEYCDTTDDYEEDPERDDPAYYS